jgi:hypothetical protein
MVFQEATSELAGKTKKLTAWHLMSHNKHLGKQGWNCQFHNHKIFNTGKTLDGHHSPLSICLCSEHQLLIFIHCQFICCCLSVVIRLLASCLDLHSFISVWLPLILFLFYRSALFDYSVFNYLTIRLFSAIFCSDTGIVFQVFWSPYQQPSGK